MLRWDEMPIEAVLLDLDDTLLDNQLGLEPASDLVSELVAERLGDVAVADVRAQLRRSSEWFWSDEERHRAGRLDMPAARRAVLAHLLESLGRADGRFAAELGQHYSELRDASLAPIEGAFEALARLRDAAPALGLVTNGAAAAQRAKIERFALSDFFDVIVVEGEFGAGKPDARVFWHATAALRAAPAASLMAGDNYECDVLGALRAGLQAVWIEPRGRPAPAAAPRRHRTLPSLSALVDLLGA